MRIAPLILVLFAAPVFGEVASGPKEGDKAAELKVYAVTGEPKGKEVNYTELRKDKSTIYVFWPSDKKERPIFRFRPRGGGRQADGGGQARRHGSEELPRETDAVRAAQTFRRRQRVRETTWLRRK